MDPYLVLLFVLLVFVLLAGGVNLLRREPLSARFAVEALLTGGLLLAVSRMARITPAPIVFFVMLYLVTMRSRLLVDLANGLSARGHQVAASRLYDLGLRLATIPLDRRLVVANQGASLLHVGRVAEAVALLEQVLSAPSELGIRLEAACHCNLGLAYLRQGLIGRARVELQEAADLLPGSIYARRALQALKQLGAGAIDEAGVQS